MFWKDDPRLGAVAPPSLEKLRLYSPACIHTSLPPPSAFPMAPGPKDLPIDLGEGGQGARIPKLGRGRSGRHDTQERRRDGHEAVPGWDAACVSPGSRGKSALFCFAGM